MQTDRWPRNTRKPSGLALALCIVMLFQFMPAKASPLDVERAGAFLNGLLDHPNSMDDFINEEDVKIARRLGIGYFEAPCKPLIAWDLSAPMRDRLRQRGLADQFTIEKLDDRHSRLVVFPDDLVCLPQQ